MFSEVRSLHSPTPKPIVIPAPDALRDRLRCLSTRRLVAAACRFRPGTQPETPEAATKLALRSVARRYQTLWGEIAELDIQLDRLVAETALARIIHERSVGLRFARRKAVNTPIKSLAARITGSKRPKSSSPYFPLFINESRLRE